MQALVKRRREAELEVKYNEAMQRESKHAGPYGEGEMGGADSVSIVEKIGPQVQMIRVGEPEGVGDGWWMEDLNARKEPFPELPSPTDDGDEHDGDKGQIQEGSKRRTADKGKAFKVAGDGLSSLLTSAGAKRRSRSVCPLMNDPEALKFEALYGH